MSKLADSLIGSFLDETDPAVSKSFRKKRKSSGKPEFNLMDVIKSMSQDNQMKRRLSLPSKNEPKILK